MRRPRGGASASAGGDPKGLQNREEEGRQQQDDPHGKKPKVPQADAPVTQAQFNQVLDFMKAWVDAQCQKEKTRSHSSSSEEEEKDDDDDQKLSKSQRSRHGENSFHTSKMKGGGEDDKDDLKKRMKDLEDRFNNGKGHGHASVSQATSQHPFTKEVMQARVPAGFKVPTIDKYDGTSDPTEHLQSYDDYMNILMASDALKCRAFAITLKGPARSWYSTLPSGSISGFDQLSTHFCSNFVSSRHYKRMPSYLFTVKQQRGESLRAYLHRFNTETLQVEGLDSKLAVSALQHGLWPRSPFQ